jgi:GDP-4-dehydro-6-deoxy-D-mannose reductase
MKRAFITGIAGFVGSSLARRLLEAGVQVQGCDHPRADLRRLAGLRGKINYHAVDILDGPTLQRILLQARPDRVFHLAGQANVGQAWSRREATLRTNVLGCFQLLEAVRRLDLTDPPRIVVAGSGEQYGLVPPERQPIVESEPFAPRTPYATSKVCQEYLCRQYSATGELEIVVLRLFNHIGPGQNLGFVAPDFADQVARIEAGLARPVIRVGNLAAIRDFTDVEDVVEAYLLAAETARAGEAYNVASGRGVSIRALLTELLSLSTAAIRVQQDPARSRPADIPQLVGNATKFRRLTGWKPTIPLRVSLQRILDAWRERHRRRGRS